MSCLWQKPSDCSETRSSERQPGERDNERIHSMASERTSRSNSRRRTLWMEQYERYCNAYGKKNRKNRMGTPDTSREECLNHAWHTSMIRCGLCNTEFESGEGWQGHMDRLHDWVGKMQQRGEMTSVNDWVQWLMAHIHKAR